MPNNVTAPAGGIAFATDEVGGVHFPFAKLAFGAEDIAIAVADSAGARLPVTVGGTVSVSGSLTNAELRAAAVPVAVQTLATATRAYDYAAGQRLTTSGAGQVRSAAVAATEVLLHASVRGFFRVGDAVVSASVGAGSIPLESGEKFHLRLTSGQFVSFIRDGASDGSLSVVPVAA